MKRVLLALLAFGGGMVCTIGLVGVVLLGLALSPSSGPTIKRSAAGAADLTVTVSESHVQTLIDRETKGSTSYRNVKVKFEPGNVVSVAGEAGMMGLWFPVQVRGSLASDGEVLHVNVAEMKVGSLPIKLDLAGFIDDPMTRAMRAMLSMGPYKITGVSTQQGSVTINLTMK